MTRARRSPRTQRSLLPGRSPTHLLEPLEPRTLLTSTTLIAIVITNPTATAYVISTNHTALSGTVTFTDGGSTTYGTATLHAVPHNILNASSATVNLRLPPGTRTVVAHYNGDVAHSGSSSTGHAVVLPASVITFGAAAGQSGVVRAIDFASGTVRTITPFVGFNGAVNASAGDVNGDGFVDIVVAPGAGGGPFVRVYDFLSNTLISSFAAMNVQYTGGLSLAVADVSGDGHADIITSRLSGVAEIKEFSGSDNSVIRDFNAFVPSFTGGVRVAAGDLNGDGTADVAAVTANFAAVVCVFDSDTSTILFTKDFGPGYHGGGYAAVADTNGDGTGELIVSYGPHASPLVQIFHVTSQNPLFSFSPYPNALVTGGVYLAAADLNNDGKADYIINSASSNRLRFINGANGTHFVSLESLFSLTFGGLGYSLGASNPAAN